MSPTAFFNVRCGELAARWNFRRQFLAPAILPITRPASRGKEEIRVVGAQSRSHKAMVSDWQDSKQLCFGFGRSTHGRES